MNGFSSRRPKSSRTTPVGRRHFRTGIRRKVPVSQRSRETKSRDQYLYGLVALLGMWEEGQFGPFDNGYQNSEYEGGD
jgi:hypothetical protein